jgi:hypothetical protein
LPGCISVAWTNTVPRSWITIRAGVTPERDREGIQKVGFAHATASYSWISPPSSSWRRTLGGRRVVAGRFRRAIQAASSVWPAHVVMLEVDPQHTFEMAAGDNQQPVQALDPCGAHPLLRIGIRPRPDGGEEDPDALPTATNTSPTRWLWEFSTPHEVGAPFRC